MGTECENRKRKMSRALFITLISYIAYLVPIVIGVPLAWLVSLWGRWDLEILENIFTLILLLILSVDYFSILVSPVIQGVLSIRALVKKKWRMAVFHIFSAVLFCGALKFFFEMIVQRM